MMNNSDILKDMALARNDLHLGEVFHFRGAYQRAEEHYNSAQRKFEAVQRDFELNCSADLAAILHRQAKLADDVGSYAKAERLYLDASLRLEDMYEKKGIEISKQSGHNRDNSLLTADVSLVRDVVDALYHLALFYHHRWQEYELAEDYYRRAMDISGAQLGATAPETLQITAGQALLGLDWAAERRKTRQQQNNNRSNAETKYSNALDACGLALNSYVAAQCWLTNNLAVVYQLNGELHLATLAYEQAVDFYKANNWTSHFSYAVLLTNYAVLSCQHERNTQGRALAHKCFVEAENIYLDAHNRTYPPFYQVADFLYDYSQSLLDKESVFQKLDNALELYCSLEPEWGHEKVISALAAYWKRSRNDPVRVSKLDQHYRNLIQAYERALVSSQSQVVQNESIGACLHLARVQHHYAYWLDRERKDYANAKKYYQFALTIYERCKEAISLEFPADDVKKADQATLASNILDNKIKVNRASRCLEFEYHLLDNYTSLLKKRDKEEIGFSKESKIDRLKRVSVDISRKYAAYAQYSAVFRGFRRVPGELTFLW